MANSKKSGDEAVAEEVRLEAVAEDNGELEHADHVVNHEPLASDPKAGREVEKRSRVRVTGNRTLQGAPSDVHAALVTLSNLHRNEAAAYDEVSAVLAKYEEEDAMDELHPDVVEHLSKYRASLKSKANLYHATRALLEQHA